VIKSDDHFSLNDQFLEESARAVLKELIDKRDLEALKIYAKYFRKRDS